MLHVIIYLVMVGRVVLHDLACWARQVLRGLGRDRDYCGGRGEGRIQGQSLLQAEGAGEGYPPPPRPHHLVNEARNLCTSNWLSIQPYQWRQKT